jgi:anti-sigma regulatory factor (Ser/Thr protein kinase)
MLGRSPEAVLFERGLALCAHPAELSSARRFFDAAAADFGLDELGRYQVTTAANEAVSNAIRHGAPVYGGCVYLGAAAEDGKLVCSVHDGGSFELLGDADPDPNAEHGRGLPLMNLLMDEVALDTGADGTVVRLSKRHRA